MEFIKPGTNIPFTSYRKIAVILSTAVNLLVLIMLFVRGPTWGSIFRVERWSKSSSSKRYH